MARCETRGESAPGAARRRYDYHRPRSLAEALALARAQPEARYIAGGTDVMVRVHAGTLRPPALISLRGIGELRGISLHDEGASLGALTTIAELCEHPELGARYPLLALAARRMGGPQVRNAATLGGNLCNASPCADTAPPLLVLGASVRLASAGGERVLPLERFFRGPGACALEPGELLAGVTIPPPAPGSISGRFWKQGRVRMDLALASAAVELRLEGALCRRARIAVGSVAPVPLRLPSVEALLEGHVIDAALLDAVEQATRAAVAPIDDVRASAGYRRQIVGVQVRRAVAELAGHGPGRVASGASGERVA